MVKHDDAWWITAQVSDLFDGIETAFGATGFASAGQARRMDGWTLLALLTAILYLALLAAVFVGAETIR